MKKYSFYVTRANVQIHLYSPLRLTALEIPIISFVELFNLSIQLTPSYNTITTTFSYQRQQNS